MRQGNAEKPTATPARRDATVRGLARLRVRDLMTRDVVTLAVDQRLDLARDVMDLGRFRHLPVVEQGRLVGLLTHRDLLRSFARAVAPFTQQEKRWFGETKVEGTIRIGDVMTRDVTCVQPKTSALWAGMLLRSNKFGCLPVVENGQLVGIVTEADFLSLAISALAAARVEHSELAELQPVSSAWR